MNWSVALRIFQYFVTGLGIGWLIGLSTSPVLGTVLASIMGSVAALLAATHASPAILDRFFPPSSDAASTRGPNAVSALSALVVAMTIGASGGVWARTHDWFAPGNAEVIKQWTDLGLDGAAVRQRVFDAHFPKNRALEASRTSVLFNATAEECSELTSLKGKDLISAVQASTNQSISSLARPGVSGEDLEKTVHVLCGQK